MQDDVRFLVTESARLPEFQDRLDRIDQQVHQVRPDPLPALMQHQNKLLELLASRQDPLPSILENQNHLLTVIYEEKATTPKLHAEIDRLETLAQCQEDQLGDLRTRNEALERTQIETTRGQNTTGLLKDNAINGFFCELFSLVEAVYPRIASKSLQEMETLIVDSLSGSYRSSLEKEKLFDAARNCLLAYQSIQEVFR